MALKFGLEKYTLDEFFNRVVEKYAGRPSLAVVGEEPFSYKIFSEKVRQVQAQLRQNGIKKGGKMVILGNSSPNWGIAFLALTTMGAVAVPVMEDFPENDIDHIIRHSGATGLFISQTLYESLNLPALEKLTLIISLNDFSVIKSEPENQNLLDQIYHFPGKIKKTLGKSPKLPPESENPDIREEDVAEILYTSGTTGHSKGVMLTHRNLVSNLFEGPDLLGVIHEKSVILAFLPMAHAFGSTSAFLSIIYCGASIYYLNRKPSPKILLSAMQQVRPTVIGAVPLIFEKIYHKRVIPALSGGKLLRTLTKSRAGRRLLYRAAGKKIMKSFGGRLECAIIGGAALNPEVETFLRQGKIPYAVGYGLSETSPLVTFSSMEKAKIGSVGHTITGVEIKIENPDPKTGVGEILVKGPNVMKGYYKNEAENKKVFTGDGWFITGDRGRLDKDGFLYIKGRSKNIIVGPSGENIYPEVIEEKLKESLFVEEALVYQMNGRLVARIYPDYEYIEENLQSPDENQIAADIAGILESVRTEINTRLSAASRIYKIMEQTEPFIKTPTNKIKRGEYIPDYL